MSPLRFHGISELRKAAIHRQTDALHLFQESRFRGAMYLRGYTVECLLKVGLLQKYGALTLQLLAKKLEKEPDDVATHSLQRLAKLLDMRPDPASAKVFTWDPQWRYSSKAANKRDCQTFFDAASAFEHRLLNDYI